jgi:hypothetical protein
MKLLTKALRDELLRNGRITAALAEEGKASADFALVVKYFTPYANCTWLLTELDPDEPDIAFGLCDLGMGFPELGSVSISELEGVQRTPWTGTSPFSALPAIAVSSVFTLILSPA